MRNGRLFRPFFINHENYFWFCIKLYIIQLFLRTNLIYINIMFGFLLTLHVSFDIVLSAERRSIIKWGRFSDEIKL